MAGAEVWLIVNEYLSTPLYVCMSSLPVERVGLHLTLETSVRRDVSPLFAVHNESRPHLTFACWMPPVPCCPAAGPLQNQLSAQEQVKGTTKRSGLSVAAGLGLGAASMLAAQNAEAAQQVADLAAGDNRFGTIALLALPVAGWVLFNILGELCM